MPPGSIELQQVTHADTLSGAVASGSGNRSGHSDLNRGPGLSASLLIDGCTSIASEDLLCGNSRSSRAPKGRPTGWPASARAWTASSRSGRPVSRSSSVSWSSSAARTVPTTDGCSSRARKGEWSRHSDLNRGPAYETDRRQRCGPTVESRALAAQLAGLRFRALRSCRCLRGMRDGRRYLSW